MQEKCSKYVHCCAQYAVGEPIRKMTQYRYKCGWKVWATFVCSEYFRCDDNKLNHLKSLFLS